MTTPEHSPFDVNIEEMVSFLITAGETIPEVIRTPEERFAQLDDYPFAANYFTWQGLRMHYVDEGPKDAPVALLLHGQPTWSYLYRRMIPLLVNAGYRCIAPDYIGFGKSDKVTRDSWYVIERHMDSIRDLIAGLDLWDITLFCQDWGGPIGLRQAIDQKDRFARLVILNTWLHHEGFEYGQPIRLWREAVFSPLWRIWTKGDLPIGEIMRFTLPQQSPRSEQIVSAYEAPYHNRHAKAGARRFPWCLPFAEPEAAAAAHQARCFEALKSYDRPVHFIFGDADMIFTPQWGQTWSKMVPGATFDTIPNGGHFVQEDNGELIVAKFLARLP